MTKRLSCLKAGWVVLPAFSVLAGCTEIPRTNFEAQQAQLFEQYAGPPVESFTYLGRYDSWTSLGQNQIVVWTTHFEAYLITVASPWCSELPFAQHIDLTQSAKTVTQRFDFVVVGKSKCPIKSIQPVNYAQMKRDMRQKSAEMQTPSETPKQQASHAG